MERVGNRIVGRRTELELLAAFARGEGDAVLALVEGEPGIGKTTLWSAVVESVSELLILQARPTAAEATAAYAALDDVVRPVRSRVTGATDPSRRALAVALLLEEAEAPTEPRAVGRGLLSLLEELVAEGPVVIAIDDWQWLDASSAAVLAFAVRRLPAGGARVLATLRTGEADAAVATLVRSLPEGLVLELPLDPLEPGELLELIHARSGRWLSAPALERLYQASGGNALTAVELARAGESASPGASDVRRLLATRIATLAPGTREVLRCVAVLSAPTVTALPPMARDAARGLEEALAADVLVRNDDRLRFSHPLYAAVVENLTPPDAWRALHRRAAGAVTDPEQRVRHLAQAATGSDPAVAAALDEVAARALSRGAPAAAAELGERAAGLTSPTDAMLRSRRLLDAADAHVHAADGERAVELLSGLIEQLPPGPLRGQALLVMAGITRQGDDLRLARQAIAEAGHDLAVRGAAHMTLARGSWQHADPDGMRDHALAAIEHAHRSGDLELLGQAGRELAWYRFISGEGVQRDALLEIDRLERQRPARWVDITALGCLAEQLYMTDDLDKARELLLAEFDRPALTFDATSVWLELANLELRAGRWQLADEYARRLLEAVVGSEHSNWECVARCLCAYVGAHLGRVDAARENGERAVALAKETDDLVYMTRARHALGFLALSLGDAEEAVRQLAPLPAVVERLGVREPGVYGIAPDLAEAFVLTGDLAAAREVQRDLAARGRELDRPWATACALRCGGLIATAEGDHDAAVALPTEALEWLELIDRPFEHGRTLLALGTAQRRAKRRGAARVSLDAALAVFSDLGARLWVARANEEIARLGGRRARDRDELTPTEKRVAQLAAEGHSNREIAAELFVSERTVEANLTRAYRKLGVRSRTQLARRLPR